MTLFLFLSLLSVFYLGLRNAAAAHQPDLFLKRSTVTEHYYVVVRMHHLLISEEPNLRLSDLLAIDSTTTSSVLNGRGELDVDRQIQKSPLTDILQHPVYIVQLYTRLQIGLTNAWNEFKSKYDPYVGKPSGRDGAEASTSAPIPTHDDPKLPRIETLPIETLPQLFASLLISYVTIANDFYKGFYATKHTPMIKIKFLNGLINREVNKRNISWEVIWNSMKTTLNPFRITKVFSFCFIKILFSHFNLINSISVRCPLNGFVGLELPSVFSHRTCYIESFKHFGIAFSKVMPAIRTL